MKLYGGNTFNVLKPAMVLAETDMKFDYVPLDLMKGEARTDEHKARHPLGKIPVLEIDSATFLTESNAICRYLARKAGTGLYPDDMMTQAKIDQWVDFVSLHPGRWLSVFFWQELIVPKFQGKNPDQAALEEAQGFLNTQLTVMNQQLEKQKWLATESYSIADMVAFSYFRIHEFTSFGISDFPALRGWYDSISEKPATKKALEQVGF